MPLLLVQIALVVICFRCAYHLIQMVQANRQPILEVLYQASILIVALWLFLGTL
ncbi:hypothetical protein [Desmospora activa]|uniref:Uncharacterized protein n=1 Tax=Desmospora activa DSM 45169 TaxID=1121389 RepID=A0A2T4ZA52_9BACL|nr:hypothetical protein [Desmospora activa]PTM58764.1 hypothetical protein C8J48_1354 [Desmospora activa DSM 45169]